MKRFSILSMGLLFAASAFSFNLRTALPGVPERGHGINLRHAEMALPAHKAKAPARADEGWEVIGQGSMTDFVVGDLFWTSAQTFTVTVEQSTSEPNTYRIQHPYANWSDPALSRYVAYDESKATPMVFHIYNGTYAWFEEFDTGLDIDLSIAGFPDSGELTVKMWGADLVTEYGIQSVAANGTSTLCSVTDGILALGYMGSFNGTQNQNVLCDIGGKYAASGSYYVANYNGEFRIVMPSSSEDAEWQHIGTGSMTEAVFSSIFGLSPTKVSVEVDQSIIDPTKYRIKYPYASWYDPSLAYCTTFDEDVATPLIIHVVEGSWAWFESFNTGVYLNYADAQTILKGNVAVTQQAESLVAAYGMDFMVQYLPNALCKYDGGLITLPASFLLQDQVYSNLLCKVGNMEGYYGVNSQGNFSITLPGGGSSNDDADWTTVGYAEYTDDIATLLYGYETPVSQTWNVPLQQYKKDATVYRLVNPYSGWENPFSDVIYDDTNDHHMVIYTLPSLGLACIGDFETGLYPEGLGMMSVSTDAYILALSYGLDFTAQLMPEIFGSFFNNEVSYPAYFNVDGDRYASMYAYFGPYDENSLYATNQSGKFKVKFVFEENGVDSVGSESGAPAEYFNLQGVRLQNPTPGEIVIVRNGSKVQKRIIR